MGCLFLIDNLTLWIIGKYEQKNGQLERLQQKDKKRNIWA